MRKTARLLFGTGLIGLGSFIFFYLPQFANQRDDQDGKTHSMGKAPLDNLLSAIKEFQMISEQERSEYIPQHLRPDYSSAMAHSRVEQAYQRLQTARSIYNE